MAEQYISGTTGQCLIGTANEHDPHFNTWSATFTREMHDVTAFGDTGHRRIPGIVDISGSAGGFMSNNVANTSPDVFANAHGPTLESHPIVLTLATGCTYTFNGNVTDVAVSSTMGGDATITFNFVLSSGLAVQGTSGSTAIETWDESA